MKMSILIPDGQHSLMIQVVYCLSKHTGVKIYVMSTKKILPMRYSRYIEDFYYFEPTNEVAWIAQIDKMVERLNIDLILPVSEEGFSKLINYKDFVKNQDKLGYLSQPEDYKKAEDKSVLAKHLLKHKIPHPKTFIFSDIKGNIDSGTLKFPVIAKPVKGLDGQGIGKFVSKSNLYEFLAEKTKKGEYIVQEFIEGYDIDCSVLCKNGEVMAYTIQRGTLFENRKFAPAIGLQFLENEVLLCTVKTLMKSLNWSGVAHIDLRYDENSKDYKIIEINGRFWGSLDASCIAGVNFPYLYCVLSKEDVEIQSTYEAVSFLNLKGLVSSIRKEPNFLFKLSFIKNNTPIVYFLKDPLPVFLRYFMRTRNLITQRVKNYSKKHIEKPL